MASHDTPGDALSRRLMGRGDGGLFRRRTADGGEVFSGPTATRALRAVGARAFTVDETIIVDEDFDLSRPEDQALYAHEVHHQQESGGNDDHTAHDAEEVAARAIERMVLHRAAAGEDFAEIMRDVKSGGGGGGGKGGGGGGGKSGSRGDDEAGAKAGYEGMLAQGKTHDQIVGELARFCVHSLAQLRETMAMRGQGSGSGVF